MSTIEDFIKNDIQWNNLPVQIQKLLNRDEAEYNARVLVYFLQNQLEYTGDLIRNVVRSERGFYRQLIQYSSQQMMLFPYHLQRKIVAGLGITPFEYYKTIVHRTMLLEYSYDRIPNFTAVDCHHVLGIGRNEFIDCLNTYKGLICSPNVSLVEAPSDALGSLLPKCPLNLKCMEPWFIVRAGSVSTQDFASQTPEEQSVLDRIIDIDDVNATDHRSRGLRLSEVPVEIFQQLYKRGLVYVDVPILESDRLSVPTLDGFIMNRITGDCCETLLYKTFFSLDPRSSIQQLAIDLGVGAQFVINAASLFCRLGFAQKVDDLPIAVTDSHKKTSESVSLQFELSLSATAPGPPKIAFIFDSSITAYLMLGNLSADLKKHSVTMFEVGKLTGESLSAFYRQLSEISDEQPSEQDVSIYYEHAKCLGQTIRRICGKTADAENFDNLDLLRCASLSSLEPDTRRRILSKNYSLLICMAPLSYEESMMFGENWPLIVGPTVAEFSSPWFRFFITAMAAKATNTVTPSPSYCFPSMLLCRGSRVTKLPKQLSTFSRFLVTSWGHDSILMDTYAFFNSINDLTMNSPVLVQAYDDHDGGLPLHQHFISLPLTNEFLAENASRFPWLKNLHEAFDLSTLIGYVSVILPDGKSSVDIDTTGDNISAEINAAIAYNPRTSQFLEYSVTDPRTVLTEEGLVSILNANRPICLLSLHLGIPLFNSALNDAVFDRFHATQGNGSNEKARSRLAKANSSLQTQLARFIKSTGGVYVENAPCDVTDRKAQNGGCMWPLPSKSYCLLVDGTLVELSM